MRPAGRITGDHVALDAVTEADLPVLHRWINDRELVTLNAPFRPVGKAEHWAWFERVSECGDVVLFAIRRRSDERLVGTCQLQGIDLRHATAELQVRVGERDAQDGGLGTEAVGLLVTHAFEDLRLVRVGLHVLATNTRAIRVYEKVGFRREGVLRQAACIEGRRLDVVVMGMLSSSGRAARPGPNGDEG